MRTDINFAEYTSIIDGKPKTTFLVRARRIKVKSLQNKYSEVGGYLIPVTVNGKRVKRSISKKLLEYEL